MRLKHVIIPAVLALMASALSVQAQVYGSSYAMSGWLVPHTVASNVPIGTCTLDVRRQSEVAVEVKTEYMGTGATNVVFYFVPSVDNVTRDLTGLNKILINVPRTAATTNYLYTNITVNGWGYLSLYYVSNNLGATVPLTNTYIKYGIKQY